MKWGILGGVVALAAAAWSGWWFLGAAARDRALEGWLAERREDGWQAEAATIRTIGFPNRFDTRVIDLRLADTAEGWSWDTPFLDILGLSYEPHHFVVALAPEQTLAAPGARATLRSETMRGSIRFIPGLALEVARLSLEAAGLALEAEAGWSAAAATLAAHLQEADTATAPEHAYDLHVTAREVALPQALDALIDPGGRLPRVFDSLLIDARAAFQAPLDRAAVEDGFPDLTVVSIRDLDARWGDLALSARGLVRADAEGYAEGSLDVRAENWREMLRAAVAAGALDDGLADAIEMGLGFLARFGGDGDAIEAPLSFGGGYTRLGPVPLGPAPRMRF